MVMPACLRCGPCPKPRGAYMWGTAVCDAYAYAARTRATNPAYWAATEPQPLGEPAQRWLPQVGSDAQRQAERRRAVLVTGGRDGVVHVRLHAGQGNEGHACMRAYACVMYAHTHAHLGVEQRTHRASVTDRAGSLQRSEAVGRSGPVGVGAQLEECDHHGRVLVPGWSSDQATLCSVPQGRMFLIVRRQGRVVPAASCTFPPCNVVGHNELLAPASLHCVALTVPVERVHLFTVHRTSPCPLCLFPRAATQPRSRRQGSI